MAYLNSYSSGQWAAIQTSSWTDQGYGWENSAMSTGGSPESTSSSTVGSPLQGHWEPYPASTHAYQSGTSTSMDSTYYTQHSEASSASYIPTTTDDSYYYSGDMTSYDTSPMPASSLSPQDYLPQDYELQEPQSPDSSRRKSASNHSSKVKRQLQNRLAQRAFRERQAKQQEELHKKVRHLKEEYQSLEERYQRLAQDHEKCNQRDGHRRDCNCQHSR